MSSKIAFVCNHRRTATFKRVAERLERSGHKAFWISTGSGLVKDILASVEESKVVDISIFSDVDLGALADLERYSEISVNGMIASDRVLRTKPYSVALAYISCAYLKIRNFLVNNNVEIVFGEATWGGELVCAAVCRELGIPFLKPVTIRCPSGRFAFFEGVFLREPVATGKTVDISVGQELYDSFVTRWKKPFYMNLPRKSLIKSFCYHAVRHLRGDVNDMTMPSFFSLVSDKLRNFINSIAVRIGCNCGLPQKYCYFPLHVQPEATIDILGLYCANQKELINNLAKAMPAGVKLVVKPHPLKSIGMDFYRYLKRNPVVVVANPVTNSETLIRNASAVVSVSGTACLEAGIYGIPAFVFADMYFQQLSSVKHVESFGEIYSVLKSTRERKHHVESTYRFLAKMYSVSYDGYAESPDVYADALSEQNISNIVIGFKEMIDYYSSSKSATADSICSRLI